MKYVLVSLFLTATVFAAPEFEKEDDTLRTKKSPSAPYYGGPVTPCAGGPLAPVTLFLGPHSAGYPNPAISGLLNPANAPYSALPAPHYRNDDTEEHNKEVSLKEDNTGRSNYGAEIGGLGAAVAASSSYALSGGIGGPAVGLFPNARVGGCAVPLLLSCSPNVIQGQLSYGGHSGYGASAPIAIGAGGASYPAYKSHETEESQKHRNLRGAARDDWQEEEYLPNKSTQATDGTPL